MKQISIQDWLGAQDPEVQAAANTVFVPAKQSAIRQKSDEHDTTGPEYVPQCYSCGHGLRRGRFRLCDAGLRGYRQIGQQIECEQYETLERRSEQDEER